jgi:hypothetical protein
MDGEVVSLLLSFYSMHDAGEEGMKVSGIASPSQLQALLETRTKSVIPKDKVWTEGRPSRECGR